MCCSAYTQMNLTTIKVQYSVHSHTHLGSTASKCFCDTDSALTVNINIISELQIASLLLRSEVFHSIEMRFVLMGVSGSGLSLSTYFHKKMGVSSGGGLPLSTYFHAFLFVFLPVVFHDVTNTKVRNMRKKAGKCAT